jgi:hypothetical protein
MGSAIFKLSNSPLFRRWDEQKRQYEFPLDIRMRIHMLISMRTTLVIDDTVFAAAKRRAVESGLTLSELTTRSLRESLRPQASAAAVSRFCMPVHGGDNLRDTTPADLAELRDDGR